MHGRHGFGFRVVKYKILCPEQNFFQCFLSYQKKRFFIHSKNNLFNFIPLTLRSKAPFFHIFLRFPSGKPSLYFFKKLFIMHVSPNNYDVLQDVILFGLHAYITSEYPICTYSTKIPAEILQVSFETKQFCNFMI